MLLARDNPFRMQRIEALRYRLDDDGWQQLLTRFAANRWRGVLVGPHGSGKTTLREEIEARLRADGWNVRAVVLTGDRGNTWSELSAQLDGADKRTLLSLDGLDRIGAITWWRLQRATHRLGGVLATSHVAGRLPTLHRHHTSAALLRDLVQDLVHDYGDDHAAIDDRCDELFARYHGDVRACLRSFYDAVGERPTASYPRRAPTPS
jgi:hypothetical protein